MARTTAKPVSHEQWGSCSLAAEILGTGRRVVELLAAKRLIGVRTLPGLPPRYKLADVRRIAESCTIEAEVEADAVAS
jgi:hypothetical protein